jgi:hypothetical protein
MKITLKIIPSIILCSLSLIPSGFAKKPSREYTEVEFSAIRIAPETYKNKYITYKERYSKYHTTFLNYMASSGFRTDKHIMMEIGHFMVPVIADKKDFLEAIGSLTKGSEVQVWGKIRQFRVLPKATKSPHYYLDLEKIDVVEKKESPTKPDPGNNPDKNNRQPRPPKRPPWKNRPRF